MQPDKSLRNSMPETAQFIDYLRKAFGVECINRQIRAAMHGEPTFYAKENGIEFGTPTKRATAQEKANK